VSVLSPGGRDRGSDLDANGLSIRPRGHGLKDFPRGPAEGVANYPGATPLPVPVPVPVPDSRPGTGTGRGTGTGTGTVTTRTRARDSLCPRPPLFA